MTLSDDDKDGEIDEDCARLNIGQSVDILTLKGLFRVNSSLMFFFSHVATWKQEITSL